MTENTLDRPGYDHASQRGIYAEHSLVPVSIRAETLGEQTDG